MSSETSVSPSESRGLNLGFGTLVGVVIIFAAGMFVGSLYKENQLLRSGKVGTPAATNAPAAPAANAPEPGVSYDKFVAVTKDDHIRGNAKAKVVLVEYSDFECPFCGRFHPTVKQALTEFGDKIAVVFRHYPLPFHPNAQKAAEGSECVTKQKGAEGFWAYADAIFAVNEKDGKLTPAAITDAATKAGVNLEQFKSCLDSGEMAQKISAQSQAGQTAGINGTPGTFVVVNGKAVDFIGGALPYESVKSTIQKYL